MSSRGPLIGCVVVLVAGVLGGCIGGDPGDAVGDDADDLLALLSQPIYDTMESFQVLVPGHDGKLQDNWVFKPKTDDATARFPVFINFSPYWDNLSPSAESGGDAFSQHMIDHFVPRGYAVVLASVRGTGNSEGCFPIGGVQELEDAYAVIDHFATVEWSNGNVASGGKSYDGTTIQGVAGYKPHPALKLVFPVSGISDLYRYNYRGGVPYFQGPIFNTYYVAEVGMDVDPFTPAADPRVDNPQLIVDDVCPEQASVQGHGVSTGATGMYNDYWNERNYIRYAKDVQAAFFYVHGFQDWNVKPDHILPWLEALPEGTVVRAYLHQWTQQGPGGHVYPMRDDWNITMLRALDHYLKGIDTGLLDEPAFHVQDSTGRWRTEADWPPADAMPTPFYLGGGGSFAGNQSTTGQLSVTGQDGGVLSFRMDLDRPMHAAGVPTLHARLATTNPEAAWVATLWLVNGSERVWMNEGVLKARLRDSMETPTPVVPGELQEYSIEFYPQDDVFPAGSALELTLSQGGARQALVAPSFASTLVDLDGSYLLLPLIEPEVRAWESPQPLETRCWTC